MITTLVYTNVYILCSNVLENVGCDLSSVCACTMNFKLLSLKTETNPSRILH